MKKENKRNRTLIRLIKAYLFGIMSGMLLLEYLRNKKRPYLPCSELTDSGAGNAEKQKNTDKTNPDNDKEEAE